MADDDSSSLPRDGPKGGESIRIHLREERRGEETNFGQQQGDRGEVWGCSNSNNNNNNNIIIIIIRIIRRIIIIIMIIIIIIIIIIGVDT